MYNDKETRTTDLKIFGIKIYEKTAETIEVLDHKFKDDEEEQDILAGQTIVTHNLFGIIKLKMQGSVDPDNLLEKEPPQKPIELNKIQKISLAVLGSIILVLGIFGAGIYTANTEWFNDIFYIKSRQMLNLNIKSLKPYDKALIKDAKNQYEMNVASSNRYKHYHEYYEKVVERIRNTEYYDDKIRNMIIGYIDGYEKRKDLFDKIMFPHMGELTEDGGAYYGTILGSSYPIALLEFDRQELLTYRMILTYMYDSNAIDNIDSLFEE